MQIKIRFSHTSLSGEFVCFDMWQCSNNAYYSRGFSRNRKYSFNTMSLLLSMSSLIPNEQNTVIKEHIKIPVYSPDNILVLLVLALGVAPTAVHDTGVHIRRAEGIRLVKKGDNGEKNCANWLRRIPALAGQLARLRIVYWRMQDRYAEITILKINKLQFKN